jgi:phosphate starvation-inducible PhoH-like protein
MPLKSSTLQYRPQDIDNRRLANLCGAVDQNLRQIEEAFDVRIARRSDTFSVEGPAPQAKGAIRALEHFHRLAGAPLSIDDIQLGLVELRAPQGPGGGSASPGGQGGTAAGSGSGVGSGVGSGPSGAGAAAAAGEADAPVLHTRRTDLQGRTPRQREYLRNILGHDITFGIGPAGTGKTYLAVACAVDALERDAVKRMVLTRPAVEAGERLGFLPGDLAQKVDPYLRPLYDALYDLMGFDRVTKMFERQTIEIAPLAYMRGRTLNHAFIILDEAQNTTPEQMKMFLTRIGFGSRAVVTGDATQIDLPRGQPSGLIEARRVLQNVRGIAFTEFDSTDVVRHPLVARIVDAYEKHAPRSDG